MKNSVKRGICLVLALVLVLCLTACGGIAGRYKLTSAESDGMVLEGESLQSVLSMAGMTADDMYIELREDGTGTMSVMGEVAEMCYGNGQIWPVEEPDEKVPFTVSGDKLTIEIDGAKMVFEK